MHARRPALPDLNAQCGVVATYFLLLPHFDAADHPSRT